MASSSYISALSEEIPRPDIGSSSSSSTHLPTGVSTQDYASFTTHLQSSRRILVICGAGLSASSGMATFRGAGGLWRTHSAKDLATPEAFARDPALVWQWTADRRRAAMTSKPNAGHEALAKLAMDKGEDVLTVTMNIDGLSERANHPSAFLSVLHGTVGAVKCTICPYRGFNFQEPIVPALAATAPSDTPISIQDLPQCPSCSYLLRPGVVWFGEKLPLESMDRIDNWMMASPQVDLVLVIGTTASLSSTTGHCDDARYSGARMAVINPDPESVDAVGGLDEGDWWFGGDAAEVLPCLLGSATSVTGEDAQDPVA